MSGFDVTEHEMVPDHVVLDDDEVEELTERYDIRPTDLPKISEKDAAARQVDASPGDVLKVVRE
ncbi:MAG: DNA-directed RNA polymerase subunit RpoH/Rpb5 C-terminal domain-containing protein, partial [Halobacteria archaeon]|nr:DNA-directed RNA polymerase subunit RpoH/Rpb5 C-terminal domain-containing protein [Halobacteria archaeon]